MTRAHEHRESRRALTRRFPFALLFLIDGERVVVLAILHQARDPDRWRGVERGARAWQGVRGVGLLLLAGGTGPGHPSWSSEPPELVQLLFRQKGAIDS